MKFQAYVKSLQTHITDVENLYHIHTYVIVLYIKLYINMDIQLNSVYTNSTKTSTKGSLLQTFRNVTG